MKTAKEIVEKWQRVIPDDTNKSHHIIKRDPEGDIAAEIALSSHSQKWLVVFYHEHIGKQETYSFKTEQQAKNFVNKSK